MSLTKQDLIDIRNVVLEALEVAVNPRLEALESRMGALETRVGRLEAEMTSFRNETNRRLTAIETQLVDVNGRLTAVENDVKELYKMIKQHPMVDLASTTYKKLSDKQKIRVLDREVTNLANHMGVNLSH